jgi:hypothetical protein
MQDVIIGVDPHKLSATIEVVDRNEQLLGSGRLQDTELDEAMGVTAQIEADVSDLANAKAQSPAAYKAQVATLDESPREVRGVCGGMYGGGRLALTH